MPSCSPAPGTSNARGSTSIPNGLTGGSPTSPPRRPGRRSGGNANDGSGCRVRVSRSSPTSSKGSSCPVGRPGSGTCGGGGEGGPGPGVYLRKIHAQELGVVARVLLPEPDPGDIPEPRAYGDHGAQALRQPAVHRRGQAGHERVGGGMGSVKSSEQFHLLFRAGFDNRWR